MSSISIKRAISAPVEQVFQTVADIRNFSEAVPDIVGVEFLSESKTGVGTRFRETRLAGGKEATTELEVTEYSDNDHIRILADAGGAVWDSLFVVRPTGEATELEMTMEARPYKLLPKLTMPIIMKVIRSTVAKDMDAVKQYCEAAESA